MKLYFYKHLIFIHKSGVLAKHFILYKTIDICLINQIPSQSYFLVIDVVKAVKMLTKFSVDLTPKLCPADMGVIGISTGQSYIVR